MQSLRTGPATTVLTCWLLLCAACGANPVVVEADSSARELNEGIDLLQDRGGQLRFDEILEPEAQARFAPAVGRTGLGQSRDPWWVRLELRPGSGAGGAWWLEAGGPNLLDLRVWLQDADGAWRERRSGEQVAFAAGRDLDYRRIVLRLPELDAPTTIYLRSYDPAGNTIPLKLWRLEDLQRQHAVENLVFGLIYGVIAAMLLYNLFLLLSLRDIVYLWYVTATASALLLIVSFSGHGFQYLWPGDAVRPWYDRATLPALWGFNATLFTRSLLQTRRHVRWAHWLLDFGLAACVASIVLELAGQRVLAAQLLNVLTLSGLVAGIGAAVVRSLQGFFPARLYLLGYGMVLLGMGMLTLIVTGLVAPSLPNTLVFPGAVAAEAVLFSFALAWRIRLLQQERAAALEAVDREKSARLVQVQASADALEAAVEARTAELAAANRQLSRRERELQRAAFHDALTGLPNRRFLVEHSIGVLADAARRKECVALLLMDLDMFKPVNDRFGHDAGDFVLSTVAQRMQQEVRRNDMAARFGGDEFALLLGGPDAEQHLHAVAARLLRSIAEPIAWQGHELHVTLSIGAALYPRDGEQFDGLAKAADIALYRIKDSGRAGFASYEAEARLNGIR